MKIIYGPIGGEGIIYGDTTGDDIIDAFDLENYILAMGANDQINTGAGDATVDLNGAPATSFSDLTDTVNVGGANNTVSTQGVGHTGSSLTVQGGTGLNAVVLQNINGFNNVALEGFGNKITVNSDATDTLFGGAGNDLIVAGTIGDGHYGFITTVIPAGQHNTVVGGDQNFNINGGQGFDSISIGNGSNSIREAEVQDSITVGGGANSVTDLGGHANVTVLASVTDNVPVRIDLGGTENTVTGMDDQNFTIVVTNGGAGNFALGNGNNFLMTDGNNNIIVEGTSNGLGGDTVVANGTSNSITLGDADNNLVANGNDDTVKIGNGNNSVIANGDTGLITVGNGSNRVSAIGNNDTIVLGAGTNNLKATGDNDTITASNGSDTIALGSNGLVTLTATKVGTSIDVIGPQDSIVLNNDANVSINDESSGDALHLTINADTGGNAGKIVLTGFGDHASTSGILDLHGFSGITSIAQLVASSTSDGAGGVLIHLGTGSFDLVSAAVQLRLV